MAAIPKKIGKYDVEDVIGRGGMGVVYKAVDSQIGRYVAIKMITGEQDESLIERFKSEARSTGSLQCPNIVTVYDVGEQDGNPYLVMQFLEGPSLDTMIKKRVALSLPESLGIIIDVCNGLGYAHQRGVIHRDIKPANIIVLQDGVSDGAAVIVDFGIARIAGDTGLTKPNQVIGSINYMSPEQVLAKGVDNRTDIYSIGVVLFQLLTGVLPFESQEAAATLHRILNDPPPPLSAHLKDYPPELDPIIARVLAKKREERYARAQDFAFDLMQVQDQVKVESVNQLVRRAEAAAGQQEWTQAREQLQQALRIDRHNTRAQRMMSAVQEQLRVQREIERARMLRNQANECYMEGRYDDALHLLDEAVALDAKNNDLVSFRDSVGAAKEKAGRLRRALRRAEAALKEGNIDDAETAVDDACEIDPHDTHARALKLIVHQQAEDRARQQQLRKVLDQAREQIAVRDLTGAFATLKNAEALDPTSSELQAVAKMAALAREQERRRAEAEELCRQIEEALLQEDYASAAARAEEGLKKFSQEKSFLKLKTLADAQRARVEQKRFVREQVSAVGALAESGDLPQALAAVDGALQKVPGNSELQNVRSALRNRIVEEESEQRRAGAIDASLAKEGRRVLEEQGPRSAKEFLDTHAAQYPDLPEIRALSAEIRSREELDALDRRLAAEPNPAKQVQAAEEYLHANGHNPLIGKRLADLQRVLAQVRAAQERAQRFEAARRFSEAMHEWRQLQKAYPQDAEFASQIMRLSALQGHGNAEAPAPAATTSPVVSGAETREVMISLSATRVLGSPRSRGGEVTKANAAPAIPEGLTPLLGTGTMSPTASVPVQPRRPVMDFAGAIAGVMGGPKKYIVIAAAVTVALAAGYLLTRGRHQAKVRTVPPMQIHIVTSPANAVVTSDSQALSNGAISLVPGDVVRLAVSMLGYKTKLVDVHSDSDAKITLDPEPLHFTIQTSEKTGIVELDGKKIADLTDGNLDEYDIVPDGQSHEFRVTSNGRPLFSVQLQAVPGFVPAVTAFDAKGLFLVASLGSRAKLYAGNGMRSFSTGNQNIATSLSGTDFSLSDQTGEITFGEGAGMGSVAIANSNTPTVAVYSINAGGQVQITSNVTTATLKVNGSAVKSQGHGWLVSRPAGKYTFELSADGYDPQKWTMSMASRQVLPTKNVNLKPRTNAVVMASLLITHGTPEATVDVDGKPVGRLDGNGNLEASNALVEGQHSIVISKTNFESREFPVAVNGPECRLADAKLAPWPRLSFQTTTPNAKVIYRRSGDSEEHEANASEILVLRPGEYEFAADAPGFKKATTKLNLAAGYQGSIPLKLEPVLDYQFQDASQVTHDGPEWLRSKDPHGMVLLKPGFLDEHLIFAKPGKNLFWNKKLEWAVETQDNSVRVEYILDGQKLVRRLVIGEEISDTKETKVDLTSVSQPTSLSVHIQVDGSQVLIRNDQDAVLDDYFAGQHNFSGGRVGIKTDSRFVVRDK